MKRIGWLILVCLLVATPALAVFIEHFDPVWEKGGISSSGRPLPTRKVFTDPTTGMEFVFVRGGCFQMGSKEGDVDEVPVHEVCVDDFYMGKYEVTQRHWNLVTESNPASFTSIFSNTDNYPVETVSWDNAQEYIHQLSQKSDKVFRLPTEAEWEYAARSGGKQEKYAGGDNVQEVAWYNKNSGYDTHPAGKKLANALGLYDMSGNVWEWCSDMYSKTFYAESPKLNPIGPSVGSYRVVRGGSWSGGAGKVRSAVREWYAPDTHDKNIGLRLVFSAQ